MTRIERRQARIRRIKHKLTKKRAQAEDVATAPDAHHHIGSSQNRYEHIPSFLRAREGDPAIQVCVVITDLKFS
jgi:biotin synthase-related radical SAM superfamily protein